jgi:hypothetical protein
MSFSKIRKSDEKKMEKQHKERLNRCIPVARKLLKIIGEHAPVVPLGDVEQTDEGYALISKDFLSVLLKEDIHWSDREFIFQLMMQAVSFPKEIASQSMERSWQVAIAGLVGKPAFELKASEVDALLRRGDTIEEDFISKNELDS